MKPQLFLSATAAAAMLLAGCRDSEPAPPAEPAPDNVVAEAPPPPPPVLDRAALLGAARDAASAYAAGLDDRTRQAALDGRTFSLAIRFGCNGPQASGDSLGWSLDEAASKLSVHAAPTLRIEPEAKPDEAKPDDARPIEAVEGFWIPLPWIATDLCPRAAAAPEPQAAPAEESATPAPKDDAAADPPVEDRTVGIAQYYVAGDSRLKRRSGRDYRFVQRIESADAAPRQGLRLRIEGRLRGWPDGRVIRCDGPPTKRPSCIIASEVDRVAIERPENGALIAEWAS